MKIETGHDSVETVADEWVTLPGGELQALAHRALCPACRAALAEAERRGIDVRRARTLCFACHRAEARRQRALEDAGRVFTGSPERLETGQPFEPVNRARLSRLQADRAAARGIAPRGPERFADERRHAQLEARRALAAVARGLRARELPLPPSWLPFVVNR